MRSDVSAVLFDEPLTVIDPHLKWQLRRKLKEIHQELNLTLIYVTHDQTEALTFAEEVVVMSRGKAVQIGTPEALFERPAHTFVGHFIGSPGMNFLQAKWESGVLTVGSYQLRDGASGMAFNALPMASLADAGSVRLGVRPEYLYPCEPNAPGAVPARISRVQDLGTYLLLSCDFEGGQLRARARAGSEAAVDDTVWLPLLNSHTCFYRDEELIS